MPFTRPSQYPDWALTGTRTYPGAPDTNTGWQENERPPAEWMNFLQGLAGDWVRWLDQEQQLNSAQLQFDATVGAGGTYADLNALSTAIVGGAVINSVLVISNLTFSSTQVIASTIVDLAIYFKKGTVMAKGASTTPGISVQGQRIDLFGPRMSTFNGGSDVAIQLESSSKNGRVHDANFVACTTAISDLGANNSLEGNLEEV